MYVVDCVKESGSRMNIVLSVLAIVLATVPAILISHFSMSALLGEGVLAAVCTLFVALVLATTFFAVVTSLFRKMGWWK
jgi:hypothetical protein